MARYRVTAFAPWAVVGLMTCACKPNENAPPQPSTLPSATPLEFKVRGRYVHQSNDGGYSVSYTPTPDPIPLNELFTLEVWVRPEGSASTNDPSLTLAVDAAMPDHEHGMNTRPQVASSEEGAFRVNGMLFHMPGRWELYFDVSRGGVTERAQAEIVLE